MDGAQVAAEEGTDITQCIYSSVSESQLPHKIVNLLFTIRSRVPGAALLAAIVRHEERSATTFGARQLSARPVPKVNRSSTFAVHPEAGLSSRNDPRGGPVGDVRGETGGGGRVVGGVVGSGTPETQNPKPRNPNPESRIPKLET